MENSKWWEQAVFYQLKISEFFQNKEDGNLINLSSKLDYFVELGVDALILDNILDNDGANRSYYNLNKKITTIKTLKFFLEKAKEKNLKVLKTIDFVSTSTYHPFFINEIKNGVFNKNSKYIWANQKDEKKSWLKKLIGNKEKSIPNIIIDENKKNSWIFNPKVNLFYFSLFGADQANLNWYSSTLRRDVRFILKHWMEIGFDGFIFEKIDSFILDINSKKEKKNNYKIYQKNRRKNIEAIKYLKDIIREKSGCCCICKTLKKNEENEFDLNFSKKITFNSTQKDIKTLLKNSDILLNTYLSHPTDPRLEKIHLILEYTSQASVFLNQGQEFSSTFLKNKLNWKQYKQESGLSISKIKKDKYSRYNLLRELIALRKKNKALLGKSLNWVDLDEAIVSYVREDLTNIVMIILNFSDKLVEIKMELSLSQILLKSFAANGKMTEEKYILPPFGAIILKG